MDEGQCAGETHDQVVDTVKTLLAERLIAFQAMQTTTEDLREVQDQIAHLIANSAEPYQKEIYLLDEEITKLTLCLGESVTLEAIAAKHTSGYDRYSWQNKQLEGYAAVHPEVLEFRKTTRVQPRVAIKVKNTSG